jgi:hypothetical protein
MVPLEVIFINQQSQAIGYVLLVVICSLQVARHAENVAQLQACSRSQWRQCKDTRILSLEAKEASK